MAIFICKEKAEEDAIALLNESIPPETIARCVKIPIERVMELQATTAITSSC